MEGLFFVIEPIWWVGPVPIISISIAIVFGIFFGIFLYRKTRPQFIVTETKETKYEYIPVNTDDPKYIEKTLGEIRRYCTDIYSPRHSWAHIPIDFKKYISQGELIEIIEQLESIEYSGKTLQIQEKESINRELVIHLKK